MRVIEVDNVSKKFQLGVIGGMTFIEEFNSRLKRKKVTSISNEKRVDNKGEFWALRDISFNVNQGDVVGIIGKNGAGKSTLLKLMSRISYPTSGEIRLKGRLASLLEVGTGFHPELSGRENIFLNGAILGMTKDEIKRKLDEIISFSGIEYHIDTPVKRYSSGMKVRLGFAVAAHLEPEILVVDEVLAVGDAEFQSKCLGKMQEISGDGRTILFVSHNMSAVSNLCTRGILLDQGKVVYDGNTLDCIDNYLNLNRVSSELNSKVFFDSDRSVKAQIREAEILNLSASGTQEYVNPILLKVVFQVNQPSKDFYGNIVLEDQQGNKLFVSTDEDEGDSPLSSLLAGDIVSYQIEIPSKLLRPGRYFLNIGVNSKEQGRIHKYDGLLSFEVIDSFTNRGMKSLFRSKTLVAPFVKWEVK